jgi:hypothetical protein
LVKKWLILKAKKKGNDDETTSFTFLCVSKCATKLQDGMTLTKKRTPVYKEILLRPQQERRKNDVRGKKQNITAKKNNYTIPSKS